MELERRLELEKMVNQYILGDLNYSDKHVPLLDLEDVLVDIIDVLGSELNMGKSMKYTLSNKVAKRFEERLNFTGSRSGRLSAPLSISESIELEDYNNDIKSNINGKKVEIIREEYEVINFKFKETLLESKLYRLLFSGDRVFTFSDSYVTVSNFGQESRTDLILSNEELVSLTHNLIGILGESYDPTEGFYYNDNHIKFSSRNLYSNLVSVELDVTNMIGLNEQLKGRHQKLNDKGIWE